MKIIATIKSTATFALGLAATSALVGCGTKSESIKARGSDTLIQVVQAWAEEYGKTSPVSIQVSGGGSGTGFSALLQGTIDIATASREIKDEERGAIKAKFGVEAVEHVVGYDGIAVYVHKDNLIASVTLGDLRAIYAEGGDEGKIATDWSEISPDFTGPIERASRQNNSGTYDFFREAVFGKGVEFRGGAKELSGSEEVVTFCANTRGGIGYSGMGYKNEDVNWLKISKGEGKPGFHPSVETVRSNDYPLSRALYLYTVGEPEGDVKAFIDWIKSAEGQKVLASKDFVPLQ